MALIIKADVQTEAALVDILDSFCSSFEARDAAARSTVPARGGWLVAQADGAVVGPARL